jgi:hypothetical protein
MENSSTSWTHNTWNPEDISQSNLEGFGWVMAGGEGQGSGFNSIRQRCRITVRRLIFKTDITDFVSKGNRS